MAIPRILPAVLGAVAGITTLATLTIHIVLTSSLVDARSSVRTTSIVSSVLEATALIVLCCLFAKQFGSWAKIGCSGKFHGVLLSASLMLCIAAAGVSASAMALLAHARTSLPSRLVGVKTSGFLIGASVVLGLTFAAQLLFLVVDFLGRNRQDVVPAFHSEKQSRNRSPLPQVKSIPYHETSSTPSPLKSRMGEAMHYTPPSSSGGRSATETLSSFRSSLSHVVRPITSRTRLLSQRSSRRSSCRPSSLDSNGFQGPPSEDGFDSWDTSGVDPQNRQTVLEVSTPSPGRFLETIPASPVTSRAPSPGYPLDIEPPRTRRRSRSYSPASTRRLSSRREAFTQQPAASVSESHIHPLFRSDSPIPPPPATPGTVVTAAPNAGHIISDRHSIRSLSRMRSGSTPTPNQLSPLSRQGSFDSAYRGRASSITPDLPEEADQEQRVDPEDRKMTPPIPDWILSADRRTSMSGYRTRKLRSEDERVAEPCGP